MASTSEYIRETKETIENYVQNRIELVKLQVIENAAKVGASLFLIVLMAMLGFFMFLFLSFMLAWFFADLTGNVFIGLGIMTGIFIILIVIIILGKKTFERKISDSIINTIFSKSNDKDDENEYTEP